MLKEDVMMDDEYQDIFIIVEHEVKSAKLLGFTSIFFACLLLGLTIGTIKGLLNRK